MKLARILVFFPLAILFLTPAYATTPVSTLTSPNAQMFGQFGGSVAASGNILVVGAILETANGQLGAGHAYMFNTTTGAVISTLTSPNAQLNGAFGFSVAASGNVVVVGTPSETANLQSLAGHAYIFNATTGALISTLTSPNVHMFGEFGWSVAASGNNVMVSAIGETVNGQPNAGHVYEFDLTGALIRTLTSPNLESGGSFGWSLAASGNNVVVGAPGEDANGQSEAGHAYTFNAITGALTSTFTSPNAQLFGFFGGAVAARGNILVVGATNEAASGQSAAGQAYAFNFETGGLISTLKSPNPRLDGFFGASVAVRGHIVVVGAASETVNGQEFAGHAYTFNSETGGLISTLTSPNPQLDGLFGVSVAASAGIVVVGAGRETANGQAGAGNVYIF